MSRSTWTPREQRPNSFPVRFLLLVALIFFLAGLLTLASSQETSPGERALAGLRELIAEVQGTITEGTEYEVLFPPRTEVESLELTDEGALIVFNESITRRVWLEDDFKLLRSAVSESLDGVIELDDDLDLHVAMGAGEQRRVYPFEDIVTSAANVRARQTGADDPTPQPGQPIVQRVDYAGPSRERGLLGRNIVVNPSHGWTWHKENRWQLQRARVYTIVEDLYPASYCNPFLIPMLENAGAVVFSGRERDYQVGEVIVDNDAQSDGSSFATRGEWRQGPQSGWRGGRPIALDRETEPFGLGTTLITQAGAKGTEAEFVPYIPHDGRYAVYASWPAAESNSRSVPIDIHHAGGQTTVRVNQRIGGGTWVFLGFFEFLKGANPDAGRVVVDAGEASVPGANTTVTIDAIRFGGGMGNIATGNQISGKPRYAEASTYYLQYAGTPREAVYDHPVSDPGHFGVDYVKDIIARAEWPNYLNGAPNGINSDPDDPGLGVPIDAVIGWHTDAGYDQDGLIGTLSIYRIFDERGEDHFPDGRSRLLNRDLTVMIHEEIMRTGREEYTSTWKRRDIREGNYGEARRPNVPSTLLELLSHHNFNDMKYGLDPRFQHDMARAVYKGMLRFVAAANGYDPVIAPLAPKAVGVRSLGEGRVEISWQAEEDHLESSATPDGYIVYRSEDGRAFDNGRYVEETSFIAADVLANNTEYFRVTAANAGGESLPSPVVAVRWSKSQEPVLLVDGFDRLCGPAILEEEGARGFDRTTERGLGYHANYAVVGNQYDFDPDSDWKNDLESPGWGASHSDRENRLEPGNTFDHIVIHAQALAGNGMSFDSCTAAAFDRDFPIQGDVIDWIAGRQRSTPPPKGLPGIGNPDRMEAEFPVLTAASRERLERRLMAGGKLIMSGAHIADDLMYGAASTPGNGRFVRERLGVEDSGVWATTTHSVRPANQPGQFDSIGVFRFGDDLQEPINIEPTVYPVDSAKSFDAISDSFAPVLVYADTGLTAAILSDSVFVCGFPIETVLPPEARTNLLGEAVKALREE